ncbi:sterol desaturase family protein [Marispirochaeta aestuarii]|nr:sterol desaturase family protein [Marispirochaeta aestuarii]
MILRWLGYAVVFLASAIFFEFVAWFMHKYVMHGFGWFLHEDHHRPRHRLQKNDVYALVFAFISFLLIYNGLKQGIYLMAASGFGVALYGAGYVLFHDIMFHRRIKRLRYRPKNSYMKRIINAHRTHHSTATREGAVSFSFLYAPKKYAVDRDTRTGDYT